MGLEYVKTLLSKISLSHKLLIFIDFDSLNSVHSILSHETTDGFWVHRRKNEKKNDNVFVTLPQLFQK